MQAEYYILFQEDWKHYRFSLLLDLMDHSENVEFFISFIMGKKKIDMFHKEIETFLAF